MSHDIIEIPTKSRQQLIEITPMIEERVKKSGIRNGVCFIYVPHTTAGITVNENADPSVVRDILHALDGLIPVDDDYIIWRVMLTPM